MPAPKMEELVLAAPRFVELKSPASADPVPQVSEIR